MTKDHPAEEREISNVIPLRQQADSEWKGAHPGATVDLTDAVYDVMDASRPSALGKAHRAVAEQANRSAMPLSVQRDIRRFTRSLSGDDEGRAKFEALMARVQKSDARLYLWRAPATAVEGPELLDLIDAYAAVVMVLPDPTVAAAPAAEPKARQAPEPELPPARKLAKTRPNARPGHVRPPAPVQQSGKIQDALPPQAGGDPFAPENLFGEGDPFANPDPFDVDTSD